MSTNFPTSLDDSTSIPVESAGTVLATNHVASHTNLRSAILAIEAIIGITASAVTTTFTYILSEITGGDTAVGKSATQSISNKTYVAPKFNITSHATGDIYYDGGSGVLARLGIGTVNYILKVVAGVPAWVAETVTVNATTSVAGILELATASEITAGTATGGSGAPLAVTPDGLASSAPTFDGSNLTNIPRFLTSGFPNTAVSNTTTTVLTYALAGGILSTNKGVRMRFSVTQTNSAVFGAVSCTIAYGGTTIASFGVNPGSPQSFTDTVIVDIILLGSGATNTQRSNAQITHSGASPTYVVSAESALASLAKDSTTSQNITVSLSTSSANITMTLVDYFIEKIV
jgi:hypothetical protein